MIWSQYRSRLGLMLCEHTIHSPHSTSLHYSHSFYFIGGHPSSRLLHFSATLHSNNKRRERFCFLLDGESYVSRCVLKHRMKFCHDTPFVFSAIVVWGTEYEENTLKFKNKIKWRKFYPPTTPQKGKEIKTH